MGVAVVLPVAAALLEETRVRAGVPVVVAHRGSEGVSGEEGLPVAHTLEEGVLDPVAREERV